MTRGRTYRSGWLRAGGAAGLSLVELLVVLGIIGLISAVLVPAAIQNGWFTSSKSSLGARELFTLLKAASVYAGTYNVETALAYGGRIVTDSETGLDVPVVDTLILARRLKREEIIELQESGHTLLTSPSENYYVPVPGPEGIFRPMPNQTCILPDVFTVEDVGSGTPNWISNKGLTGVRLYDVAGQIFLDPRFHLDPPSFDPARALDYVMDEYVYDPNDSDNFPPSFPAHRFKPDGTLRVNPNFTRQRFQIRAGVLPEQEYRDRFYTDPQGPPIEWRPIPIVFHQFDVDGVTPLVTDTFYSTDPDDHVLDANGDEILDANGNPIRAFADIDVGIEMFVATGRIRISP